MWIPWCVGTTDFKNGHYITVDQMSPNYPSYPLPTAVLYAIWQKDNTVCYSTDAQYHNPGTPIPGICAINGDRGLTINSDLTITVILV
ncbi:hypothetical protein KSB_69310 [Ktedonobacter robiniae]|uniref:Chitin-binding type-4 domain-containing protein n=2 Tax=Ktedonobacter robiniae TaxID=2778365 RepID=A0ABQ3V0G0_9CHLR|nr:hypothetical protein KSB_69310 [Ktedonobacter robiniae]